MRRRPCAWRSPAWKLATGWTPWANRATSRCVSRPRIASSAANIEHLPIAVTGTDMMVPLEQIATITMDKGPARIQHLNGKRTVTVLANVRASMLAR